MGLLALTGFLLTDRMGWDWAFPVFLIGGLLLAPLIPAKGSCSIKTDPE
ncbi:MAG: hypothetical protein ACYTHK_13090 [Planctomycetota bacterium]